MIFADAARVAEATPYPDLVDALERAFADPAAVAAPPRAHHRVEVAGEAARTLLMMPAWSRAGEVVAKLVNVVPGNAARELPAVQAAVLAADAETGAWTALLDGGELTARRTAAASALAARRLARADAATLLLCGAGRLARPLIEAHASQRPIRRVLVWARRRAAAEAVAAWAAERGFDAAACALEAGVAEADLVSCATLSDAPLVRGAWLRPGQHLDLVGAFRPDLRETDAEAVRRAQVFVDTREGARGEAGDLIRAEAEGAFDFAEIRADLFQLCDGSHPGRESPEAVTLFKSVGAALEDFAAARLALSRLGR